MQRQDLRGVGHPLGGGATGRVERPGEARREVVRSTRGRLEADEQLVLEEAVQLVRDVEDGDGADAPERSPRARP